jgi:hypothetical protein
MSPSDVLPQMAGRNSLWRVPLNGFEATSNPGSRIDNGQYSWVKSYFVWGCFANFSFETGPRWREKHAQSRDIETFSG